jgi:hypothetical protein
MSDATNLAGNDSVYDVYVRDRTAETTSLVSKRSDGLVGNGDSIQPGISGNGRYVAFSSAADNLWTLPPDTNGANDIFEYDLQAGGLGKLSVASDESPAAGGHSFRPDVSGSGDFAAFESDADNLVLDDNGLYQDIYTHEWDANHTDCTTTKERVKASIGYLLTLAFGLRALVPPDNGQDRYDERCQDIVESKPDTIPSDTTTDPYEIFDTFTDVATPPETTYGGTVYLRWGSVEDIPYRYPGWGYRHISARHGWGASMRLITRLTLENPDSITPNHGSETSFQYSREYEGSIGANCQSVVIVEYTKEEWTEEAYGELKAKDIISSWADAP